MGKIGVLVLAGGMIAGLTSPSLAEYVVVKLGDDCAVMEESAAGSEVRIAGPFATEEEGEKAKTEHADCMKPN
jgi:hypothetical protein